MSNAIIFLPEDLFQFNIRQFHGYPWTRHDIHIIGACRFNINKWQWKSRLNGPRSLCFWFRTIIKDNSLAKASKISFLFGGLNTELLHHSSFNSSSLEWKTSHFTFRSVVCNKHWIGSGFGLWKVLQKVLIRASGWAEAQWAARNFKILENFIRKQRILKFFEPFPNWLENVPNRKQFLKIFMRILWSPIISARVGQKHSNLQKIENIYQKIRKL